MRQQLCERLEQAINSEDVPLVAELLRQDSALVSGATGGGLPLFLLAVGLGCVEIVDLFLRCGADINVRDGEGNSSLHLAAEPAVARLLLRHGAATRVTNQRGEQPLHIAAQGGNLDLLSALLDQGSEINATCRAGWTALHWAVNRGEIEPVDFLLMHGADPDIRDAEGDRPIHFTKAHLSPRSGMLLGVLLEGGASLDCYTAVRLGMTTFVRCLLQNDPTLAATDPLSADCLGAAVRTGRLELVALLLEHGFDVNACRHSSLPLWYAVQFDEEPQAVALVTCLLAHGADPRLIKEPDLDSPLNWVQQNRLALLPLFARAQSV